MGAAAVDFIVSSPKRECRRGARICEKVAQFGASVPSYFSFLVRIKRKKSLSCFSQTPGFN